MKRIVVATDLSARSDRAVRRAGLLAGAYSAELELVHVVEDSQPEHLVSAMEGLARAELERIVASTPELVGTDSQANVVRGDAFDRLASLSHRKFDLLVMGSHRKSLLKDVVIGTTLERVLRVQIAPILVVNQNPAAQYSNILIAVDFSDCSRQALETPGRLGLLNGKQTTILYVSDPSEAVRADASSDDIHIKIAADALESSRELTKFLGTVDLTGIQFSTRVRPHDGPPGTGIKEVAAELGADLVVVGTRGRNRLVRMMLGSVTDDLLKTLDTDLLVVPWGADYRD
ncbi:MAG: universal stress protein [Pseudorhodoplanes sp.]